MFKDAVSMSALFINGPLHTLISSWQRFATHHKGPYTPDAIRQRDAIFRFSLTDNFDPSLNFQLFRSVITFRVI
jgi:hypothetical protein